MPLLLAAPGGSLLEKLNRRGCCLILGLLSWAAVGGCGQSYDMVPAILNIAKVTNKSKGRLLELVNVTLKNDGFRDLGKDTEMIALFERSNGNEVVKQFQLARLNREHHFVHSDYRLRVVLSDYVASELATDIEYAPPDKNFIEIRIYEERPDGFSANGLKFYKRFISTLQGHPGTSVSVIKAPVASKAVES